MDKRAKKSKLKLSIDFQIHKPVLTHRLRRQLKKCLLKVKLTNEQIQDKVNSQAKRLERRNSMTPEEKRQRRITLRSKGGIHPKFSEERAREQLQNQMRGVKL
jgi:hypothetical protein